MRKPVWGCVLSIVLFASGCTLTKTANPLSPTVAGPLPGVNITAPNPVQPRDGQRIFNENQPVTLMLENATTTSVRPFTYLIEIATDAGFANKVFTREGVAPSDGGRTAFRLPDPLPSGQSYWWRAKAKDGANDGPYSASANFEVIVPVVFGAPTLVAPIGGVTVSSLRPTFTWNNASRSGAPIGTVSYDVEVSEADTFAVKAGTVVVNESAGAQTSGTPPQDGAASTQYFWHARAKDLVTTGPWSGTQSFRTPAPAPPPPPPGPTACHIGTGAATTDRASLAVFGCGVEFPGLLAPTSGIGETEVKAEELLLRTIWHLQLGGFQAARHRNPSQTISKDKLDIVIGSAWHTYDIYGLGNNGVTINGLLEICAESSCADPIHVPGIPD